MGEVYEADDLELKTRVALKTVLPQIAADARAMERFRREILLARQVTHPNVCRVFDVFRHPAALSGELSSEGGMAFLAMELLEGRTLADRIHDAGRMSCADALPIVGQIAAGLDAAHKAGVIHRDFKSRNVILVPVSTKNAKPAIRAVVTDFGLACVALGSGHLGPSLTGSDDFVGTPLYMAPEQVEGGEVSAATDIYALGVVLYEMMTATYPFIGETRISTALKRLRENAPSPRVHVPELNDRWEAVILRCLERAPAGRFASALEVADALSSDAPGARWIPGRKRRFRNAALGLAVSLAVLFAAYAGHRLSKSRVVSGGGASETVTRPAAAVSKPSLAILGFSNASQRSQEDWISTALSEALNQQLAASDKLQIISGNNVARAKLELSLNGREALDAGAIQKVRANVGADIIIDGSYTIVPSASGNELQVETRVVNTATGQTLASLRETGKAGRLLDLASRLGGELRRALGAGEISDAVNASAREALPSSSAAVRFYVEGLEKLRLFDATNARGLLEKAVSADPGSPLPHAALAEAWEVMGYDEQAKKEAKKAADLGHKLTALERSSVECRYRELSKDWAQAIETCRPLWKASRDIEYGLALARIQSEAGKGLDARATLAKMRTELSAPWRDDPRVDLTEAEAARSLSDYRSEQELAASATQKAKKHGSWLLEARARLWECIASQHLKQIEKARQACEDAKDLYSVAGDRVGLARTFTQIAQIYDDEGDVPNAKANYEAALKNATEVGSLRDRGEALMNLGTLLLDQDDLAGARQKFEDALRTDQEIENREGWAKALLNLGIVLQEEGKDSAAAQNFENSLALFRELHLRDGEAIALSNLGHLLWKEARLTDARKQLEAARAIRHELGVKAGEAITLRYLGDVLLAQDDLAAARKSYEDALAIQQEIGAKVDAAYTALGVAIVSLEQNKPVEAERIARDQLAIFQKEAERNGQAQAAALLAETLLAQKRAAEAAEQARYAQSVMRDSRDAETRLATGITVARVHAATGKLSEATQSLQSLISEAKRLGWIEYQFEARLALTTIQTGPGKSRAGRGNLAKLEKEAKDKGLALIARKAASANT